MAMRHVSRTLNPLHFEDLEPHRFEDLVRQLAHGFRPWRYLDATGRQGRDGGVDIRGVEMVALAPALEMVPLDNEDEEGDGVASPVVEERVWRIQCKRYKEIGPKLMRDIVAETVPDAQEPPYGVIVAAACDVSSDTMSAFRGEVHARGVAEAHLWTKAHLEDLLFLPEHDHLLFAYFGISLAARRRSQLQHIREAVTLKRKLLRALKWGAIDNMSMADVLVRDIEDDAYPDAEAVTGFDAMSAPPWHVGTVEGFQVPGLLVCRYGYEGWVREDGSWDVLEDSRKIAGSIGEAYRRGDDYSFKPEELDGFGRHRRLREQVPQAEWKYVRELWWLPFTNILEVDPIGDAIHAGPHLYCRFNGEKGPYVGQKLFLTTDQYDSEPVVLNEENRHPLFATIEERTEANGEQGTDARTHEAGSGLHLPSKAEAPPHAEPGPLAPTRQQSRRA